MPRNYFFVWCAIEKSHSIWSSPRALIESENQAEGHISLESSLLTFQINSKNK
jgi:hypothetical protein